MAQTAKTQLDVNDGQALRVFLESLRAQMTSDRSSWDPQWSQLASFFDPYSPSWDYSDTNYGNRRDYSIINETGLLAKRTLQAGMLNGMSPPSGKWFKVGMADRALNMSKTVRAWCEAAEEETRKALLKSNFYESLLALYGEEALYGTAAMLILTDPKTKLRCYPFQVGRYYLSQDNTRRINVAMRILYMTAQQIVDQFGIDNVSSAVKTLYTSNAGGNKEIRYPVVHALYRSDYFGKTSEPFAWTSIYYEMGSNDSYGLGVGKDCGLLSRGGFSEYTLIVGRWRVIGENVWGTGCGTDCLGSVMSLQAYEERLAQATEKGFNPPMVASADMDPRRLTTLPGEINFSDAKDVSKAFMPAYQVDFKLDGGLKMVERIEARINDAMYRSLFQMFSDSDRREMTAEETRARASERMTVLGPVVERNVEEVLAPAVMRTLQILDSIPGALPPMPQEMKGKKFKLEFESILAQAQKMRGLNNLSQFGAIAAQENAVDQGALDNVDIDEFVRTAAELTDVPSRILRTPEEVAKIRADKQRAANLAAKAEAASKLAPAAQVMSNTPADGDSLLNTVMPQLAGGLDQ